MEPTANPTRSEVFTAYNKARASLRKAGDVKGIERLNRAIGILQSKAYYNGERALYHPTIDGCSCKDWEYRKTRRRGYCGCCKHMQAERLRLWIMAGDEAGQDNPF